ncbi:MAG: hypothetical protein KBF83_15235 [Pyrinomonadaceae bacterium]|nr:hypothetical protein [Acidobacteriota bacterium]MBP7475633.1 hypothetical protein [Pyrinomonadaceae bacterium]MBP9110908.1 hypothetical protein [Pyrinomonadaceae bacterium]
MELEFDKEMDAILRRSGRGVLVGDKPLDKPKHLDADAIAAFVENAVPAPTRRLYIEHFADCDRCRKLLSSTILMNNSAAKAAAPAAVVVAAAESIPWYQRLFRTPNLAIAMGALILTFSGVLGYMVLQNREDTNVAMAPAADKEVQRGPYANETSAATANAANTVSNTAANIAPTPAANGIAPTTGETENKPLGRTTGPADSGRLTDAAVDKPEFERGITLDGVDTVREQPKLSKPAPAPEPVVTQSAPGMVGGVRAEVERKEKDDAIALKKSAEDPRNRRDLPAAPAKSGPTRSVGPIQSQTNNQIMNQAGEMAVTRAVGGKTFDNRNGAWYDRAYRNQTTTNYRRGTAEYKKLDSGLRSIADNLGGTVVLVWKDKAYRIN